MAGVRSIIKDGTGGGKDAQVSQSNNRGVKSNNLHVTIASVEPGFSLPTQLGISGEIFDEQLLNASSPDMNVDGSVTPVEFAIGSDPVDDIILSSLTIFGSDGNIKLANFLGENSPLTNGVDIEIKADDNIITFRSLLSTNSMINFASVGGVEFFTSASGDSLKSTVVFSPAIPLRKSGTFGAGTNDDDYIKITINDDLASVTSLEAYARGAKAEAGVL